MAARKHKRKKSKSKANSRSGVKKQSRKNTQTKSQHTYNEGITGADRNDTEKTNASVAYLNVPVIDGRGELIFWLGLIGLFCFGPLGIAAWVMGRSDLEQIERGKIAKKHKGPTEFGATLGIIAVVVWGFALVFTLLMR